MDGADVAGALVELLDAEAEPLVPLSGAAPGVDPPPPPPHAASELNVSAAPTSIAARRCNPVTLIIDPP
ncbi:hypothetical protein GCM10009838_78940 [Catenulispora subtropica]|uniref:Uncharacterized protein n=1 Tax=Catenulispora subtropica TaxID=450798 RepID=A0ABP5EL59_9ACTN